MEALWYNPVYRETVFVVLLFIFAMGTIVFLLRKKNAQWLAAWASIKSWLFAAPMILFILGLPPGWTLVSLTVLSVLGSKTFFQLTGMYHRSYFVWLSYVGIIGLAYLIYWDLPRVYDLMPMIFLGGICFIPLLRNNYIHMIQYIGLSLISFCFLGWAFLHLGRIALMDSGAFLLIYIVILTEFSENVLLIASKVIGKFKPFSRITTKRTFEAFVLSFILTLILAWGMRHLLPIRSPRFWLAAGTVACFGGVLGDLVMTVIRRDLGIKQVGAFIIGRGDFLRRMDRLIFVAPLYYYALKYLMTGHVI
ncbi:MAG: phosphatidate cytidylyltransferase [Pseudomonadota bacterium]|nr:phosphatidate cytidylyltransferase [Pseudomonadota bacterium]